ncbi:hypothetical protein AAVH_01030 [Aphelenchoides avenae]|nr:hypothetical protein AAVH_01030 [Aphelenchus avenae]
MGGLWNRKNTWVKGSNSSVDTEPKEASRSQSVDDPFRSNMQRSASVFSYFSKNADEIREVVRSVGNRMRSVKRRTRKKKNSVEAYSTDDSAVVQSAKSTPKQWKRISTISDNYALNYSDSNEVLDQPFDITRRASTAYERDQRVNANPARPTRHVAFDAVDVVHEMDKSSSTEERSNRVNNNTSADVGGKEKAKCAKPHMGSTESLLLEVSRYDNVIPQKSEMDATKNETPNKTLSSESVYDSPQDSSSSLKPAPSANEL